MSDFPVLGHSLTDQSGRFLAVDQDYSDIVGLSPAAISDKSILDITYEADRDGNDIQLRKLSTEGTPFKIRKRYVRPDGSLIWVENHVSMFRDGIGPQRLVAVTRLIGQASAASGRVPDANPLVAAVRRWGPLTSEEEQALLSAFSRKRRFETNEEIIPSNKDPEEVCVLMDGFAGQAQLFRGGGRQIASLLLPGDLEPLNMASGHQKAHAVVALSKGHCAFASRPMLKQAAAAFPNITRYLWMNEAADAARLRVWTSQLGRRSAVERTAHLICEVFHRLSDRGLTVGHSFAFPVSQSTLADMLGLSVVHMNRSLRALREANLITWRAGRVQLDNIAALISLAEFDPSYLKARLNA